MVSGKWTNERLPPALRAEAVRVMLSEVHLPWTLRLRDREACDCRLDWHEIADSTLVECRIAPLSGARGMREIRGTDEEHLGLLLVLSGQERVRQGEITTTLGAGDLLVWDSTLPIDFEVVTPLHKITILMPKARVARSIAGGGVKGARPLDSRSGLGTLVAGHVAALGQVVGEIPAGDRPLAMDVVVDLLGRLMSPARSEATRGDLRSRALRLIETRLDETDLSPSTVAGALGVSPRFLHMSFAGSAQTVSGHIRARRLDRMRRDLADPRLANLSITQIALRWGFADSAHAARSFRRAFGLTPTAFRAGAIDPLSV